MTFRLPVNTEYVSWRDGQKVVQEDLVDEQNHFLQSDSAIVNNFFGSGVILESPNINVIFDSDNLSSEQQSYVVTNDFDGRGISPHNQPTDSTLGNQLELILTDSNVSLRTGVKVCIIGTDFEDNIQYETFTFNKNESQVGKKHYKTVITLLFNDFFGNKNGSKDLGGRLVVQEAAAMLLSRDEITASQNYEPNLFFRDFRVVDPTVGPNPTMILYETLRSALAGSGYSVDALNINIGYVDKKSLVIGDISTRYGQKFQAKVNNIQKVRILLGVEYDSAAAPADWYDWSGDLIISIHAIQTTVACPTDTLPDNAIDYQPFPSPIVQAVITQATLRSTGIVLTDVAQPVDVIFTNTRVGGYTNTGITPDNYYVVTVQRAGDTSVGDIFTLTGRDYNTNAVFTEFNGITWVDDPSLDMWFEIYSDSLKVASGVGYDAGSGIAIEKTIVDSTSGSTIDYCEDGVPFANNGQNVTNYTIVQAITEQTTPIQDSRTGNPVYSRQFSSAQVSTVTVSQLSTIEQTTDPIVLGCSFDINNRASMSLYGTQCYIGMTHDNVFCIVNPDATLLLYNLVGGKFVPDVSDPTSPEYLIYKTQLCTDGYGDLNGDGYVGYDDVLRLNALLGEDLSDPTTQQDIVDGYISILEMLRGDIDGDGVITVNDIVLINALYNKDTSVVLPFGDSFQRLCLYVENLFGRNDDYHSSWDGYARIWSTTPPSHIQYGTSPLLPGSPVLEYYGYPVPVDIPGNDATFTTVPFVPVGFSITISPRWFEEFLKVNSTARYMPCTFTEMTDATTCECVDPTKTYCQDIETTKPCHGGRNDFFVPDNLIIGNGQILSKDGSYFPVDVEIATITLKLPPLPIADKALDVFHTFVAEAPSGNGFTTTGFPAMKFADCCYVQGTALANNQVRFAVSLESLCISVDGYDIAIPDGYGVIVDPLIGTYMDSSTGVLTIRATNIYYDPSVTLNCKILITVYLKKAGWNNTHLVVEENQLETILGL